MNPTSELNTTTMYLVPMNAVVIGFAVVVALLIILLIAVLRRPSAGRASREDFSAPAAFEAAPAPSGYAGVDPQVVAAIAAAVAVMGQSEGKRLVVRSVRRSGGWADAGRRESAY